MKNIRSHFRIMVTLLMLVILTTVPVTVSGQEAPKRAITNIAGDLYSFQNNFHVSVFYVTPDGVIATDPIDKDAAAWLKTEIKKRFDKEIKYVVYSHDHRDHIAGGEVFADTAVVVAHENAKAAIIGEKRPTAVPDITFNDKLTIELGGKSVDLAYVGRSHSDNMIVMHFPAERAVFTVDFVSVKRLPYMELADAYIPDWIEALKFVEGMDFDLLVPGHGPIGTKQDLTEHREYFEKLYEAVLEGVRGGKTLDELKKSIRMDEYKSWGQYEAWLPLNIEGVYQRVVLQRRGN